MNGLDLKIIAEKINDSIPGTNKMLEAGDIDGIVALARTQAQEGAAYIDVNIGLRSPELMGELVRRIQAEVSLPLCVDSPDVAIQKAGIGAYDPARAGGEKPLINSISELRMELLELLEIQPIKMIVMCTERAVGGERKANTSAQEIFDTALRVSRMIKERKCSISNDDLFFDPGMTPVGTDMEGLVDASIEAVKMIGGCEELAGCHMSVGLSNFSVQLPPKTTSGDLIKTPLESAYLTLTNSFGMDYVIGNPQKKYCRLEADHPALVTVKEVMQLKGIERLMRIQQYYTS